MDVYFVRASNNLRVFDVKTTFCSHNMKDFTRSSECALHLLTVCTMHYINIFHSFALLCSAPTVPFFLCLLSMRRWLFICICLSLLILFQLSLFIPYPCPLLGITVQWLLFNGVVWKELNSSMTCKSGLFLNSFQPFVNMITLYLGLVFVF